MGASTRGSLRPAARLARHVLLPPLLAVVAVLCLLLTITIAFGPNAKATNPLVKQPTHDEVARQLTADLEGRPTPADIRRAIKPLSERKRLLAKHPYYSLYTIAKQRFGVSLYLVAAVHYQETGFEKAPATLATSRRWTRHRTAAVKDVVRPAAYPNQTERHPHTSDDFDVVMTIAAGLEANGARGLAGGPATDAIARRYGAGPEGRLSAAMVLERARAWQLLGTLPMPGRGELATPAKGIIGGCGYFGCPRPGHLHNGLDFLAPTGTPIHAAEAGVIASVESPGQSGGYGNFVCIQHRPSLATCYAHMSAFAANIRPGARVRRGQVIGLVGSTGHSTAPHLHFEVRRGPAGCSTCSVDPLPLLSGEVPEAALPEMARAAPSPTHASNVPAAPVAVAPPAAAPPPAGAPAPAAGSTPPATPGDDAVERAPDPASDGAPRPQRPVPTPSPTGGTRPTETTAQKPAPTAPAPAPAPAAAQPAEPAAPAPAPPPADTGSGGAVPSASARPPAPAEPTPG